MHCLSRHAALAFAMLALSSAPVAADGGHLAANVEPVATEYQAAISQALDEYALGHFEEARTLFAKAHELNPSARTWRGLGMAEFELRNYPSSIRDLEAALSSAMKPLEGDLRAQAEALLGRAREFVARVEIDVRSAAEFTLRVDGATPPESERQNLLLVVGEHIIEASAKGYQSERRRINLIGGKPERVVIVLTRIPGAEDRPAEPRRAVYKNPWLWAGVGVVVLGAAALGVGLASRKDSAEQVVVGDPEIMGGLVQTLRVRR